jgi:hypothetical protein
LGFLQTKQSVRRCQAVKVWTLDLEKCEKTVPTIAKAPEKSNSEHFLPRICAEISTVGRPVKTWTL